MNFWKNLETETQWKEIIEQSWQQPVLVFKHSTRCSISVMALDRFNRSWESSLESGISAWYLDLLNFREISNLIATETGVEHQSPQLLLMHNGLCEMSETHQAIRLDDFLRKAGLKN